MIGCRAGNATITVTRSERGDVYNLQTLIGTTQQADWSWDYPDECTARSEARRVAEAFAWYGTDVEIAARRHELEFRVRDLLNSRLESAGRRLRDVSAELSRIETLADAAAMRRALSSTT